MKPKDLIRALGAADPSDIEEAAPNVHRRDQTPDISAVLDAIRAEQEDGCTAARIEICENKEHRRGLVPVLLGACSMAACALIVAGMAYVLHDNSRLPMTASNVAADVTEITAATETTAAETTIVLMPDTTTTVTADGMRLHTLPYVRTTAPRDPSAEPADAIETEPPENPDAPKQLPVIQGEQGSAVLITTPAETTVTTTTTVTASFTQNGYHKEDILKLIKNEEFSAPSFVMQWEEDQNREIEDVIFYDFFSHESAMFDSPVDSSSDLKKLLYVQENDGYRAVKEITTRAISFMYQADGYIPEIREIVYHEGNGLVTFKLALVPADVHGIVRVYLPNSTGLSDYDWIHYWIPFRQSWGYEVIGTDAEQNIPPTLSFEAVTETEVNPMD